MARDKFGYFVEVSSLLAALAGGCTAHVNLAVMASKCINPIGSLTGKCSGAVNESHSLEVRLYQLKDKVDPCAVDFAGIAQGKDLDTFSSVLAQSKSTPAVQMIFNVEPQMTPTLYPWDLLSDTKYLLALTNGFGHTKNSARLIPLGRLKHPATSVKLHFSGYDICLDRPCEVNLEVQCR